MCGWKVVEESGRNSSKTEGYLRMKSMGRNGNFRVSLFSAMMEIGRDLEGSSLMRFLRLISGFRFFSLSTAWSRPRSRTGLKVKSNRVRSWFRLCCWIQMVLCREKEKSVNRIVVSGFCFYFFFFS